MSKRQDRILMAGMIIIIGIAVFPLTQIMLLTLNGGFTYVLALPFGVATRSQVAIVSSAVVNSVLLISGLLVFSLANRIWIRMLSTFLIMFSGQTLMLFAVDKLNGDDRYLLWWLILGGVPVLMIFAITLVRYYLRKRDQHSTR